MEIVILEGSRGVGKSTVARSIREKISEVTLVNPTGFHLDGDAGLHKVQNYYEGWLRFMEWQNRLDAQVVFDRFFFSEMVFSTLYKEYDFSDFYYSALDRMMNVVDKVTIVYFVINDEEELKGRLIRDKVPFGKAEESVHETMRQQSLYDETMAQLIDMYWKHPAFNLVTVNTTGKTQQEVEAEVLAIVGGN